MGDIEGGILQTLEQESGVDDKAQATPETQAAEVKPEAVPQDTEDPEIEVIPGKKFKRSQILEFEKGHMLQSDYTKKTQELAQQRKELEELAKFGEFLRANPQKLQRVLNVLEDKEEQIQTQKDAAQTELDGLDPNDPYAQMIKQHISGLSKQLETVTQKLTSLETQTAQERQAQAVQSAQKTLNATLEETAKSLQFDDDESRGVWKRMVLSDLKDKPVEYKDEDAFKSTIQEIAKAQFDILNKVGEKRVKKYLDSKKAVVPPPATGASGQVAPKKPTLDDMEAMMRDGLERESATAV